MRRWGGEGLNRRREGKDGLVGEWNIASKDVNSTLSKGSASVDQQTIQDLSSTGRHQECLQACHQLLQNEPENPFPWKYGGKSLLALGQFEKAKQCLTKAHQLDNQDPEILKDIGNIFCGLQDDAEAIRLYKAALSIDNNYAPAINNLGLIAKRQGDLATAAQLIKRACELDQSFAPYYMNLGGIYQDLGNLDQALASTLKCVELEPDNPDGHINLGGIYKDLGNLDQALASTLKSLEHKPNNATAHMNLGSIYKDLGNLDQALASTLKSLELKPDNPNAHMNMGNICKDLGNLDQALASTLKSLELKPDNPNSYINLGIIYKDLGNFDQAITCLEEANKYKSTHKRAKIELAQIYYYLGKYIEGIKAIKDSEGTEADNIRLSLHLCLDNKKEFNKFANDLIKKGDLNQQGIAAIDHANILFEQKLDNGLRGNTLDSIHTQNIKCNENSESLARELMREITSGLIQSRAQGHLANGWQTSGNILDIPRKPFQDLKRLLIKKICDYNKECEINTDRNFEANWEKNQYSLRGWAIIMNKGGNLSYHNHEAGWLTGTFYLQMPEEGMNKKEGAIEFSHQGPKYPVGNAIFEKRTIRPVAGDLNIFSSSLFHRTLPFNSNKQRICIAFDISKRTMR